MGHYANVSKAEVRRRLEAWEISPEAPYIEVFDAILDILDRNAWQHARKPSDYLTQLEEATHALAQWYICLDPEAAP